MFSTWMSANGTATAVARMRERDWLDFSDAAYGHWAQIEINGHHRESFSWKSLILFNVAIPRSFSLLLFFGFRFVRFCVFCFSFSIAYLFCLHCTLYIRHRYHHHHYRNHLLSIEDDCCLVDLSELATKKWKKKIILINCIIHCTVLHWTVQLSRVGAVHTNKQTLL